MKKLFTIIIPLSIILTLTLSGCVNIKVTEKSGTTKVIDKDINYTVTTETNPEFLEEPKDEELNFFDSIDNAIKGCRIEDYTANCFSTSKIIKLIDKSNGVVAFILQNENDKDCINIYKLRKATKKDNVFYSEPIYTVGFAWKGEKRWIKELTKRVDENEIMKYNVIFYLQGYNYLGNYNLEENSGDIKWGCTADPNIKNLTINGQKPTEIIELKMDGDDVYFWYYENLPVDYDNIMDMEILY